MIISRDRASPQASERAFVAEKITQVIHGRATHLRDLVHNPNLGLGPAGVYRLDKGIYTVDI